MYCAINKNGDILEEGTELEDPVTGKVGKYTGWMPPHQHNPEGLMYIQFEGKEWEDSFLPPNINCKLVYI